MCSHQHVTRLYIHIHVHTVGVVAGSAVAYVDSRGDTNPEFFQTAARGWWGVCVRGVGFGSFICGRADIIEINGTRDLTSDCILLYKETCDYKGEAHYWARSFRLLVERESVSTN